MSSQGRQHAKSRKGPTPSTKATDVVGRNPGTGLGLTQALCVLKVAALVGAVSLATLAWQLALHPLYGATVSSLYIKHVLTIACLLSALCPPMPAHRVFLLLSVLLALAPLSAKQLGGLLGRWDSALWGPTLTQIPLIASFAGLSCVIIKAWLTEILPPNSTVVLNRLPLGIVFIGVQFVEQLLWKKIPFGGVFTSCNMFLSLAIMASMCGVATTPSFAARGRKAAPTYALSATVVSVSLALVAYSKSQSPCASPHLPATFTSVHYPPTNSSLINQLSARLGWISPENISAELPRNVTVNLLARSNSVTGTIVVGEYVEQGFRFLRADHSILGGRWIGKMTHGAPIGESIYGAFTLQEAIRMVERNENRGDNALVIGLGIGIAAEALIAHGNKVHVIEIDPSVYAYARGFFNLSEPHAVHLVDARGWVHDQHILLQSTSTEPTTNIESSKFSMVIHDCFSGGGVPSHLFTLEFWEELKGIMTADGALAVNFAGHLGSEAARAIWFTLQEAFSPEKGGRGCRVFHDLVRQPGEEEEDSQRLKEDQFLNMVYFCQKDDGKRTGGQEVRFRKARDSDYLQSWLRRLVLSSIMDREVTQTRITGLDEEEAKLGKAWVLTDSNNRLDDWQHGSAIEHWGVMRQVMPYNVWEIY